MINPVVGSRFFKKSALCLQVMTLVAGLSACNLKKAKEERARTEAQAQSDVAETQRRELRSREVGAALAEQAQVVNLYHGIEGIYDGELEIAERSHSRATLDVTLEFEAVGMPSPVHVRERELIEVLSETAQIALKLTIRERVQNIARIFLCSTSGLKVNRRNGTVQMDCVRGSNSPSVEYKIYFSARDKESLRGLEQSKIQDESLETLNNLSMRDLVQVNSLSIRSTTALGHLFLGSAQRQEQEPAQEQVRE